MSIEVEVSGFLRLSTRLCPWLQEPLNRLESARGHDRLAHAWLIKGPQGIGKINLALFFAHRILEGLPPETEAPTLEAVDAATAMSDRHTIVDHHPDLYWLYPEERKTSISVDAVRAVIEALSLTALRGKDKIVIIEPVEAMTSSAANALLKTLEAPTPRTYLFLVSHQADRLLPTIRSRCQALPLRCPSTSAVGEWLGLEGAAAAEQVLAACGVPLRAAELLDENNYRLFSKLQEQLVDVSRKRLDPQTVAEAWHKKGSGPMLEWLIHRIQLVIRRRVTGGDSVTDCTVDPLHNAWKTLSLKTLFTQLSVAEKVLDQLGSGLNTELALRVLLLNLQPGREQE